MEPMVEIEGAPYREISIGFNRSCTSKFFSESPSTHLAADAQKGKPSSDEDTKHASIGRISVPLSLPISEHIPSEDDLDLEMRDPDEESFNRVPLSSEHRQDIAVFVPRARVVIDQNIHPFQNYAGRDIPQQHTQESPYDYTGLILEEPMRNAASRTSDCNYLENDKENQCVRRGENHVAPYEFMNNTAAELSLHLSPAFSEGGEVDLDPSIANECT